ncbi:MAG: hypothetical protein KDB03_11630 [Planctomycetales bacterium]|nr:hypothetical protein [Planctomycetales bacterium]
MKFRIQRLGLILFCCCTLGTAASLLHQTSCAAAESPEGARTQLQWAQLDVKVQDASGEAIEGAAVMPYAMRMVERQGHGYWDNDSMGPPKYHFTDETGIARMDYPSQLQHPLSPETLHTQLVTFMVLHSDYVQQTVHFELGDAAKPFTETVVTMERGCEIQLAAQDANGQSTSSFAVVMAGPAASDLWVDDGFGGKRTSAVKAGTWQTMLVQPQSDDRTLFSGVLPLRVRENQTVKIRNIRLEVGSELIGTLSAEVPRPIHNGWAIVCAVPQPAGESWAEESPSLTWHDYAEIQPDGSFSIPSIPRTGQVQIIAICDGWVSQTNVPEARGVFVMGQLFEVSEGQTVTNIEMEPTGTLEVTLLTPDGSPLQGGRVSSWPNQCYYKGGSTLLGARSRSIDFVRNTFLPLAERSNDWSRSSDYQKSLGYLDQPVIDGRATLRGIPLNRSEHFILSHEEFKIASLDEFGEAFTLTNSDPTPVEFNVIRHADPVLKAEDVMNGVELILDIFR